MRIDTECRICIDRKESFLDKYISRVISGDINILVIKEEWIMLERLKEQREFYVSELEALKLADLELVKAEKLELVREQIAQEVEAEHNAKIAEAELKISHYDFVIAEEEAKQVVEEEVEEEVCINENEVIGG